ncbi:putative HTH-type transcriptional regulator [compost metagenome]
MAAATGVSAEWLANGTGEMIESSGPEAPGSPNEKDYALIPQYRAKGACGDGYYNDHVQTTEGLVFKRDWLRRMNAKPENLFVIYAEGDSMEPYIFEGDVVLFDTSQVEPKDKQVYVLRRPDGGNSIKRLSQQFSGAWMIRSDNQDKASYPDEPVTESAVHEIPLLGRVIWRGGGIG